MDDQKKFNILLAEDDPINQALALAILKQQGWSVVVVDNGQEAVTAMEKNSFDLVLMDVQMPVLDGYEAVAAIRKREEESGLHTPIIAMTAHAMDGAREKCISKGMDGYLAKPVDIQNLLDLIGRFRNEQ